MTFTFTDLVIAGGFGFVLGCIFALILKRGSSSLEKDLSKAHHPDNSLTLQDSSIRQPFIVDIEKDDKTHLGRLRDRYKMKELLEVDAPIKPLPRVSPKNFREIKIEEELQEKFSKRTRKGPDIPRFRRTDDE